MVFIRRLLIPDMRRREQKGGNVNARCAVFLRQSTRIVLHWQKKEIWECSKILVMAAVAAPLIGVSRSEADSQQSTELQSDSGRRFASNARPRRYPTGLGRVPRQGMAQFRRTNTREASDN